MKHRLKFSLLSILLLLCSCTDSSIPSESDIERNLANLFTGCEYIEISNVKKLDGMPQANGVYLVKTTFDINIKPIEENIKLWKEYSEKLENAKSLQQEVENEQKKVVDAKEEMEREFEKRIQAATSDEEKQSIIEWKGENNSAFNNKSMENLERYQSAVIAADLNSFDTSGNRTYVAQLSNFNKLCPINDNLGKKILLDAFGLLGKNHATAETLANGGLTTFEYQLNMIKTENGWQLNF